MSIAGGVDKAVTRGHSLGCQAVQIFTRSTTQWSARPLASDAVGRFAENLRRTGIRVCLAHDCYLINLASPDKAAYRRSFDTFLDETRRAEALGLPYLVMHPGCHMGAGEKAGLRRIVRSLDRLHQRTRGVRVRVLVETTAGQGTCLGYRFEHLAEILEGVGEPERVGICLDTCHVFAAGYDLRTLKEYNRTMRRLNKLVGLDKVMVFHLNDSLRDLGSRVDRHQHIGRGRIGLEAFRFILNDSRFAGRPMVLETPKGKGNTADKKNLAVLRSLFTLPGD